MNNKPTPQQFCESKRYELPKTNVRVDGVVESYKSVEQVMQEYGELCAKYGAKSTRYQVIDLLNSILVSYNQDTTSSAEYRLVNELGEVIRKIQSLEP